MNQEYVKNTHCSYCGTKFTEQKLWPRKCFRCYNDSFVNPIPVVVVMLTVYRTRFSDKETEYGLLIQKRGINPEKGKWALTGGYIDDGETWQEAAVREVREELGVDLSHNFTLHGVESSTKKNNMLVVCSHGATWHWESLKESFAAAKRFPNSEVEAIDAMWDETELCFPVHNEYANKYLRKLNGKLEPAR